MPRPLAIFTHRSWRYANCYLPVVTTLPRRYPALDVRLTLSDRVVRLVEEGIDVAVRIAELPSSSLRAARVATTRRVLVASPHYLAARGTPERLTDLHDHALIAVESLAPNGEWRFGGPGRPAIRFEPRLLTNSMRAAIDAARAGAGITRALCYQVRAEIDRGELVPLLSDFDPPGVPISLLYAPNRQRSANVRAFIDATKAALSGLG